MEHKNSPAIFYGWYIVIGSFFLLLTGIGIAINCQSVLFKPVVESLGFSRGDFSLFMTITALSTMIVAPFMGKMLSEYNIRVVMGISTIMATISFCLLSQCTTLVEFYLCALVLGAGLAGTHVIPVSMMITNWFKAKRGLALGLAFAASGIGGLIFNPITNWLILQYDWRITYLVLGCCIGITTIPVALFIVRARPADMGLKAYGDNSNATDGTVSQEDGLVPSKAIRTHSFWMLAAVFFLTGIVSFGMQLHIPAYLTDLGYSSTFAANIVALFMGILVAGKLILGSLCDRFGHIKGVIYAYSMLLLAALSLFGAQALWLVLVFSLLYGLGSTVMTILPPLLVADVVGQKSFAVNYGILNIFLTLGCAVGVPFAGYIFDMNGSYGLVWGIDVFLCLVTIVLAVSAVYRSRVVSFKDMQRGGQPEVLPSCSE